MRRPGPRPAAEALRSALDAAAPRTPLSELQRAWPELVGPAIAAEARPVSERDGTVVVECRSGVWAHELDLMASDLLARMETVLEEGVRPRRLRFVAGGRATSP